MYIALHTVLPPTLAERRTVGSFAQKEFPLDSLNHQEVDEAKAGRRGHLE